MRSSSAPPRPNLGTSATIWAESQPAQRRSFQQPTKKAVSKPQQKGSKQKTTILFVPPSQGGPPPLYPLPVGSAPVIGRRHYIDQVPAHPGMTVNSQAPICTRKTTVKTNTITISSKSLPPFSQPTPPAIEHEPNVGIPEGELRGLAQERGGLITHGLRERTAKSEPPRRTSFSDMRLPSIGLDLGLSDSFSGKNWDSEHNETRGREEGRPRLRVQLPPPPIGSSLKPTPPRENSTLGFVIHAGDVIPSEAPPRTLEDPIGSEPKRHTKHVDSVQSTESESDNISTPRVTLAVAQKIEWPNHLLDPFFQFQVGDSQNLDQALSKPSSLESTLGYTQPISIHTPRLSPLEQNRRLAIKRKPAPPVQVYLLPITLTESNDSSSYDAASMAIRLQDLFSTDASELRLPRAGPEPSWNSLDPNINGSTMLPPRPHSTPPGSANSHNNAILAPPSPSQRHIHVESPTETHWQTLSSLDLSSYHELNIYLEALSVLAGTPKRSRTPLRFSTSSSHYSDDSAAPNSRISSLSSYSYHSNLPSPSEYIAYPSPQFKYSLIPRPRMGAVELPGVVPVELPGTEAIPVSSSSHPQSKSPMVNVGQLRLPTPRYSQPGIKTLDVLLTAPSRFPIQEQDMPCRTTILKGSRRVTFIRPRASQSTTARAGNTTNNFVNSGLFGSGMLSSAVPINMAGSGKGLLNRENSRRIRERGGSILRKQGRDVYLELVNLGHLVGEPCYEVFLNRLDGSVWFVLKSGTNAASELAVGVFDEWLSNIIPRKQPAREQVVAVRWADGLDCVDAIRGLGIGNEENGAVMTRQRTMGEVEVECPEAAAELEGVEVYLGVAVEEEEGAWFVPEGW